MKTNRALLPSNWKNLSARQQFKKWNHNGDIHADALSAKALIYGIEKKLTDGIYFEEFISEIRSRPRLRHRLVALKLQGLIQ